MKKLESSRPRTRGLRQRAREPQHTPLQVKMETPHSETKIRGRREEISTISLLITLCPSITITCQTLPLTLRYPLARLTITNRKKHCMKNYLYSLHPEVWQVVCDGVDFLDEDNNQLWINSKRFIAILK
jgi:hypothetical protein